MSLPCQVQSGMSPTKPELWILVNDSHSDSGPWWFSVRRIPYSYRKSASLLSWIKLIIWFVNILFRKIIIFDKFKHQHPSLSLPVYCIFTFIFWEMYLELLVCILMWNQAMLSNFLKLSYLILITALCNWYYNPHFTGKDTKAKAVCSK